MGNSAGIIVPKTLLATVGARIGDQLELSVQEGRLVAELARPVRDGWSEDAAAVGQAEEPDSDWLDFPNDEDGVPAW
jgi:antitoxin MazE